jgi:predicted MFS family arabinose efflux permease
MSAFSVASVLGVPAGLKLALWGGWRLPFFAVAGAGIVIAVCAAWLLPPLRHHLDEARRGSPATFSRLASRPEVLLSWGMTALVMSAGFIVIPNLSTHVQSNLGFPREHLGMLYLVGGLGSLLILRVGGWLVDRFGAFATGTVAAALMEIALFIGFVRYVPHIPVLLLFPFFMLTLALRNVAYNTLTSKVPQSPERARFTSIQSAVQHLASAAGAFASTQMLSVLPDGTVAGMDRIALVSMILTALLPLLMRSVERRVARRTTAARSVIPPHEVQSGITPGSGPDASR